MFNFQPCEDCGKEESLDCELYLCNDDNGFAIACCIVYAINNGLKILGKLKDFQEPDNS